MDINLNERSVIINQGKISEAFLPTNLEPEMEALILINPIGLEIHPKYICSHPESTSKITRLHYLFSKKKTLLTSNTKSKRVLNQKESCNLTDLNVVMLEKAKKSFRNHETVILGIIIDIIKSLNR